MREHVVRKALDKGFRLATASARTRTRLAPASPAPSPAPSAGPHRTDTPAPAGGGCPHRQTAHPPAAPPNSRCVYTQTESARDGLSAPLPPGVDSEEALGVATPFPTDNVRSFEEMPGPKGYPVVGTLLEYFRKENHGRMHEIQRRNHRQYGTIFKEPFGPAKNVCVADPSIVEEILRSEGQFPNRPPYESWVLYNNLRKRRGGVMTSQCSDVEAPE